MPYAQLIPYGLDDGPSGSVTQYLSITGNGEVATWTATETEHTMCFPTPGALTNWSLNRSSAPGGAATSQYLIRKNYANSTFSMTFTSAMTFKENLTNLAIADGDYVSIAHIPTGSPAASEVWGTFEFRPTNPREMVMIGSTGDVSLGLAGRYLCLCACANGAATYTDVQTIITSWRANFFGTITKLRVCLEAAPVGVASRTFEIYLNGAGTGVTVTITGSSVTNNTTCSIDVGDGDTIALWATATNSPSSSKAWYGIVIEPEYRSEYLICGVSGSTLSTSTSSYAYQRISTGNSSWGSSKPDRRQGASWEHYVTSLGVKLSRAPNATSPGDLTKAYEVYLENSSAGGNRAFVQGSNTYNNSGQFLWGAKRWNTWNIRGLAFNTPNTVTGAWALQMAYLQNKRKVHL